MNASPTLTRPTAHISHWADIDASPFIHVVHATPEKRTTWCGRPVEQTFIPTQVNGLPVKRKCKACNNPTAEPGCCR